MDTKNEIIKEQKKELRTKVKKKISKLSRRETEESDKKILHQIKSLAEYKNADTIFCYVSTEKEINTISLLQEILDSGKRLGVPKCTGKGIMDAYEIQNLEQLKIGSYGILEPGEECDIILDPTEIQFAIIPCISCNRKGERLGHGGGYYDRYLVRTGAFRLGAAFECQYDGQMEVKPSDAPLDKIITETHIWTPCAHERY